jgi:hypothetical protein
MGIVADGFDIQRCVKAAAAIEADLTRLLSDLTESQFHAPQRTGGWSVGYCVEHLLLTGHAFLPNWDRALHGAPKVGHHGEQFRYEWWQRALLRFAENPSRLRRKTAAPFVPCSRHSIEETVARFYGMHREFVRRVAGTRGLDAGRAKVQSPFASWISYSLGFSFDLALAHERRHLSQAWQVRQSMEGL